MCVHRKFLEDTEEPVGMAGDFQGEEIEGGAKKKGERIRLCVIRIVSPRAGLAFLIEK